MRPPEEALSAFRAAFVTKKRPRGWEYGASPYATAAQLLDALWREHPRCLKAPDLALGTGTEGPELGAETVERPHAWVRAPRAGHLRYLQAFDINGQFLSACSGLELGIGECVPGPAAFDRRLPGYHRVDRVRSIDGYPAILEPGWHATPVVAVAERLGLRPSIMESHVWPTHCPVLQPWYAELRDARARLMASTDPAAPAALGLLKDCYTKYLGYLRGKDARERNPRSYRPAWYDAVVSQANARQYLTLHKLALLGAPVVAVHLDTVIVESSHTHQRIAPPAITVSDQLGKYKPAGVVPAGDGLAALYPQGKRTNMHALMKLLRETTRETTHG
jgi:hypothetical protein